jgi:hypothetical protein
MRAESGRVQQVGDVLAYCTLFLARQTGPTMTREQQARDSTCGREMDADCDL